MEQAETEATSTVSSTIASKGSIVTVEGNIGVGKTTYVRSVVDLIPSTIAVQEEVPSMELLAKFYANPKKYAAAFQDAILDIRHRIYKNALSLKEQGFHVILDRSIWCDQAFAFANTDNFTHDEIAQYKKKLHNLLKDLAPPDAIVFMDASCETCMDRIKERASMDDKRTCELDMPIAYLMRLDKCIRECLDALMHDGITIYRIQCDSDVAKVSDCWISYSSLPTQCVNVCI